MNAPQPQPKPSAEQRVMAELESQRNDALTKLALMGAELSAARDALKDSEAELAAAQAELAAANKNRAQRRVQ